MKYEDMDQLNCGDLSEYDDIDIASDINETGLGYTLSIITGKYKIVIMYWLSVYKTIRYNELKRKIGTISHKTLSVALKDLERDGIIIRNEYPQIPPKVEYSLSDRGKSLIPIFDAMCQWAYKNREWEKNV